MPFLESAAAQQPWNMLHLMEINYLPHTHLEDAKCSIINHWFMLHTLNTFSVSKLLHIGGQMAKLVKRSIFEYLRGPHMAENGFWSQENHRYRQRLLTRYRSTNQVVAATKFSALTLRASQKDQFPFLSHWLATSNIIRGSEELKPPVESPGDKNEPAAAEGEGT